MLLLSTCNGEEHTHDHAHEGASETSSESMAEHGVEEIHLTQAQIDATSITLGDFSEIKINDFIKASGTLGLPPNAYSSVSAKANGFIKNSNKYVEGSYVEKGVVMAYLENPDFIQQQQKYLEVTAELTFLKQELERQQTLVNEDAGVVKNVQKLQAEVDMKTATQKGIDRQLKYLGINVSNLTSDNIVERITIRAPMTGYITSIAMHNGMYVQPEMELMEIVTDEHLHLELDVFEKDIALLKEDQEISYTVPAMGTEVYKGEVHVIGREFNTDNKTIRIHGHLEKERPRFIKDLFIEAKIWLNNQTVQAVPEGAILRNGGSSFIFVSNNIEKEGEITFNAIEIIPGTTDKGFTSIKLVESVPEGMKIVTAGAYYVYAQSQLGEGGHEH